MFLFLFVLFKVLAVWFPFCGCNLHFYNFTLPEYMLIDIQKASLDSRNKDLTSYRLYSCISFLPANDCEQLLVMYKFMNDAIQLGLES